MSTVFIYVALTYLQYDKIRSIVEGYNDNTKILSSLLRVQVGDLQQGLCHFPSKNHTIHMSNLAYKKFSNILSYVISQFYFKP